MRYTTLHHTTPHYTQLHYTTLHYNPTTLPNIALHYITLHSLHHHKCNCNYTTLITLHHNYNSTPLQLQLQLRYTTLHPAVVGEVTDQVTTATIAATPKNTAPTTFRSISGFALPSVIHNNQSLLYVSYFWNFCHRLVRYYWYPFVAKGRLNQSLPTPWPSPPHLVLLQKGTVEVGAESQDLCRWSWRVIPQISHRNGCFFTKIFNSFILGTH